jgi:hypothetical protein
VFPSQLFPKGLFPAQLFSRPATAYPPATPSGVFDGFVFNSIAFAGGTAAPPPAPVPFPSIPIGVFDGFCFNTIAFSGGAGQPTPAPPAVTPSRPFGVFDGFCFNTVVFSGSAVTGDAPPPVTFNGSDLLQAVAEWWSGTPAINSLASDRKLWLVSAPENVYLPYVTYFLVSEVPETWTTGYAWKRAEIQINAHASTSREARTLGKTIRTALKGAPLSIDGQSVMHVLPAGTSIVIGEGLAPRGHDCWIAAETFDIPWTE